MAEDLTFEQLTINQQGRNTVISSGNETLATLYSINANALTTVADATFLTI
jgi:3-methyladenine DNA glycosylase AlkC